MAAPPRTTCFLVVWMIFLTAYLCMCCIHGEGYYGWQCNNATGCFCKRGQTCQRTLGTCPDEHCVDNPWGIGCHDEYNNLAHGKPAIQSSNYSVGGVSYPADLAVDGDNNTDAVNCTRTNAEHNPTWSVDLEGLYVVRRVVLIKPTSSAICQFEGAQLCINNNTTPETGCRDVSVPNTQCSTGVLEYDIDPPILARYVTLRKSGYQILRVCEVIVRGYMYPYNVAFGKTAYQSGVSFGAVASRAIDGNVNTNFSYGSCSHTYHNASAWWVELGQHYVVYSVTLINSGGDSGQYLRNIRTNIYRNRCATYEPQVPRGGSVELSCYPPVIERVVYIHLTVTAPLILCEVIIKGHRYDGALFWSYTCECPSWRDQMCSRNVPLAGSHLTRCSNKNYGPDCRNPCNCKYNNQCNPLNGYCPSGCAKQWHGNQGACQWAYPYLTMAPNASSGARDSITITWPKWSNHMLSGVGSVHHYVIKVWRPGVDRIVRVSRNYNTATIEHLSHHTEYNFTVTIRSNAGHDGFPSPTTTARTCGEPLAPPSPNVHSFLDSSKRYTYLEVKTNGMNQEIHRCDGFAKLTVRYEGEFNGCGSTDVLHVNETQLIIIANLTAYTNYTIYLRAVNNLNLEGPPVIVSHKTTEGVPPKMATPDVASTGDNSIEITWRAPSPPGGVIVGYDISYTRQPGHWEETIAHANSSSKVISDLHFNSTFMIRIRAKTAVGYGKYSDPFIRAPSEKVSPFFPLSPTPTTGIYAGTVAGAVLGLLVLEAVVVAVVVAYRRRRRPQEPDTVVAFSELQRKEDLHLDGHVPVYESSVQYPYENPEDEHVYTIIKQNAAIPLEDIFKAMKLKTRDVLEDEYQELPVTLKNSCATGQKRENRLKNRFQNILPYDHSRVVLDILPDDPNSDYINANFIDGYKRPRAFIAAQGPKSNTVNDFWRMIWQVNSPQIVMVVKTIEMDQQKCEQYWADEEAKQFGEIEVTTLDEIQGQDYFVRNLKYCKKGHPAFRTVKQFHFTGWPDEGVPDDPTALVKFREEVKMYESQVYDQGPIIVHCSDGVGNTGTFIALDYLFEQALAEGKVDVFQFVQSLRASRPKMVQTKEQYYLIHDTLLEELHCGITFIRLQDLTPRLRQLRQKNKTELTKMEDEFSVLGLMLPEIEESSTKTALESINIGKNRVTDIVAGNHCRPRLTSYGEGSTDYINAVFIDGYQRQDAYIVTQMPLPHTVVDFWSMLYDQQCATIVMLNESNNDSKTSGVYWPTEKVTSYGPFNVEVISTRQSGKSITVRELKLVNSTDHSGSARKVCQFQFHDWMTSKPVPPSPRTFLELFNAVHQWHQKLEDKTVTVHCMNGAHQSGLFCAMARILDKLKVEQEVDVFHTVKAVRQNRPQLIDSKEQYVFCYDVVEEYVRKFDTYVNLQM